MLQLKLQFVLLVGRELRAILGDVKNVGGGSALGIDQADFDIEVVFRERGADVVEEAGAVQRDDLDDGAVRGALVVHMDSGIHADFGRPFLPLKFSFHQCGDVELTRNGGDELLLQTKDFRGIVIQRLEAVGKTQRIERDPIPVGAGVGLQNVHAPRRDRPHYF